MRVLFVSGEMIAGDLAYRLKLEGCEVKLFIKDDGIKDCFDGLVKKTYNWKKELDWVGKRGLIVFDDVGYGNTQDKLRKNGHLVIGGSGDGDLLELDRIYGQKILKSYGAVGGDFETGDFTVRSAIAFVKKHRGKRVVKQNDHNTVLNYIGNIEDSSDVIGVLENYKHNFGGSYSVSLQKRLTELKLLSADFLMGKIGLVHRLLILNINICAMTMSVRLAEKLEH